MWIDLNFNLLTYIVLGLISLSLVIQMFYYWGLFRRLAFSKKKEKQDDQENMPPVSVIIAARNAILDLEKNLPYILYQDYPNFEVVVVNDSSDDGTEEFLTDLARYEPKLNVVHIRQNLNFFQGKKFPLSLGIKSAKHDIMLLTDADCRPLSNQWIKSFARHYDKNTAMVIGYGAYEKKKTLLGLLQQFDTIQIAMFYLSKALGGKPYMGVGRNLSYRKSLFMENKGFISHYNVASGDDDLFVQQVANKKNSQVEISKDSITYSTPKPTFGQWVTQKRRHFSTGKYYKPGLKMLLGLYPLSQIMFFAAFVWLFFLPVHWGFPLGFLLFRLIQQLIIVGKSASRLYEKFPILLIPFAELFFIIFNPLLVLINTFSKPSRWR